jgi:hypothetical protein
MELVLRDPARGAVKGGGLKGWQPWLKFWLPVVQAAAIGDIS